MQDKVVIQREKVQNGNPHIELSGSCRPGNGINQLTPEESQQSYHTFEQLKETLAISFFVPASGSGSRMFANLYAFLRDPENAELKTYVNDFLEQVERLALFHNLTDAWKIKIRSGEYDTFEFINHLIGTDGLSMGDLPKGLIPFHVYSDHTAIPFQEHLIQGIEIGNAQSRFHFTINKAFESEISEKISLLESRVGINFNWEYSEQNPETNSVAFDENLIPARDNTGNIIMRPAGHGTLIHNLNTLDSDLIFIRNIDNVQHQSKAANSLNTRKILAGTLLRFQDAVFKTLRQIESGKDFSSGIRSLNEMYDLRLGEHVISDKERAYKALNRPIRICGMVKNTGAPGGGPFWVKDDGQLSRQIIERSQISDDPGQINLMETATHFNPVELVCAVRNVEGNKFSLPDFVDEKQYFIVHKTHEGQYIRYVEQPGLWNGAMAKWLTLFYEIDSDCFSPVKTIADLIKPLHQPDQ